MQFSKLVGAVAFLAGASIVLGSALPMPVQDLPLPVNEGGLTFRGEIGGQPYEETGTVQEVWAKLKARHPEIELKPCSEVDPEDASRLMKRTKELPPLCIPVAGQDWNFAGSIAIDEGIEYLNGLDTTIHGTHGCGRVSCSYNSAIYLCVDVEEIYITSSYLASYASDLEKYCTYCVGGRFCVTGGQEFDTGGYNIIVRSDSC